MKIIPLTKGESTLVDDEDYAELMNHKWCVVFSGNKKYATKSAYRNGRSHTVAMHRFLLGDACKGMDVDHIDGNGLNNQKDNLRVCTRAENLRNRKKPIGNKYKYKGIYPAKNKWCAVINHANKTRYLGTYNTEEEAARAYDKKARELFGEFAYTNFEDESK